MQGRDRRWPFLSPRSSSNSTGNNSLSQRENWNRPAACKSPRVLREKGVRGKKKWPKTWWKQDPRPSFRTDSSHYCSTHTPPPSRKLNPTSLHATFLERGVRVSQEKERKPKTWEEEKPRGPVGQQEREGRKSKKRGRTDQQNLQRTC